MPKTINLQGTDLGTDITEMNIYHTEITGSNLLRAAVRRDELLSGINLHNVPDSATTFLIDCTSGKCTGTSGSISVAAFSPETQYFTLHLIDGDSGYYGSVDTLASTQNPYEFSITSGSVDRAIPWSTVSSYTITATPAYPRTFVGYFRNPQGSYANGGVIQTGATLTLSSGSYQDDIYAVFDG